MSKLQDNAMDEFKAAFEAADADAPDTAIRNHAMSDFHPWTAVNYAMNEFRAAGWVDENGKFKDEMQEDICKHVLELLRVFSSEGHTGSTAPYAVDMFKKLAMFEPLTPLTGEDWEWNEIDNGAFQNKRCGRVFKRTDRFNGQAYDIDARIFREPDGTCYTSKDSVKLVTFPYTPKTEYVDVQIEKWNKTLNFFLISFIVVLLMFVVYIGN